MTKNAERENEGKGLERKGAPAFCVTLVLMLASPALAGQSVTIEGRAIAILDGDTLDLLDATKTTYRIRLANIDTPEKGQPYGMNAKKALSDLVFGKQIEVFVQGEDRYGRTIGRVYVGDLEINTELVRRGLAWVYRKYCDDEELIELEAQAREKKVGLWALPPRERIAPWEWRKLPKSRQIGGGG